MAFAHGGPLSDCNVIAHRPSDRPVSGTWAYWIITSRPYSHRNTSTQHAATHRVSCDHKAADVSCRKEVTVAGVQQITCEVKYVTWNKRQ